MGDPLKKVSFEFRNLKGEVKKVDLVPLKRKEAAEIFHNTLAAILVSISSDSKNPLPDILKTLDFNKLWDMGTKILRFAFINNEEIKSLDETDYFERNPEEFYIILFHGIKANFPDFFSNMTDLLKKGSSMLEGIIK